MSSWRSRPLTLGVCLFILVVLSAAIPAASAGKMSDPGPAISEASTPTQPDSLDPHSVSAIDVTRSDAGFELPHIDSVPEPASLFLVGSGLLALMAVARRRRARE